MTDPFDVVKRAWAGEVLDALRAGGHDPGDPVQAADALALLAEQVEQVGRGA